jgi:hypothetical protein
MRLCGGQRSAPPPPSASHFFLGLGGPTARLPNTQGIKCIIKFSIYMYTYVCVYTYIYQLRMLLGCNEDVHSSATTANSGFRSSGSKDRTWSTWPIGRWFEAHKLHEVCYKSLAYFYLLHHCELHNLHANAAAAHQRPKLHLRRAAGM